MSLWRPMRRIKPAPVDRARIRAIFAAHPNQVGGDAAEAEEDMVARILRAEHWANLDYHAIFFAEEDTPAHPGLRMRLLSIRTMDRAPIRRWRDLQRIKNDVAGPEREAVELFPAEARLVDSVNQFHLFVLPSGDAFPFGYATRFVSDETSPEMGVGQAPLPPGYGDG